jgi:hypothetical protein
MNLQNHTMSPLFPAGLGRFCLLVTALVAVNGCSKAPPTATNVKKLPAGQQFSGFLKNYSAFKPNPDVSEDAMTYVHPDKMKSLHRYIAIIVDPVDIYVATDAHSVRRPGSHRRIFSTRAG